MVQSTSNTAHRIKDSEIVMKVMLCTCLLWNKA